MSELACRWNRAWFAPVALGDLAVCRIVWSLVQLAHLASADLGARIGAFEPGSASYAPLPLLRLLALPFGGAHGLERVELEGVLLATWAAGILALCGAWTRPSLAAFALGSLLLQAWAYSSGPLAHDVALLQWSLLLLALTPCGAVLGLDAWRARRAQQASRARPADRVPDAAWVLRLVQALLALAYLSAAASKVLRGPAAWFGGWTLQYDVAFQALRTGGAAGRWLAGQHELGMLLAWAVTAFEVGFVTSVLARRSAPFWAGAAIVLHAGAGVFMGVWFLSFPALCAAAIPWTAATARARACLAGRASSALPRPWLPAARARSRRPAPCRARSHRS